VWCIPERCYVYDGDEDLIEFVNQSAITCYDKLCKYGTAEPVAYPPVQKPERPYPWKIGHDVV